jgi:hypothetical protein
MDWVGEVVVDLEADDLEADDLDDTYLVLEATHLNLEKTPPETNIQR